MTLTAPSRRPTPFEREIAKLTPAQKLAIDTVEGPVMVVAGPGTGKTQVIALRVASILKKTHAKPGNILCLTFSNSGATAMRERLRSLIGPEAYRVSICTVHEYCNTLIADHPHVFQDKASLEQISDVERFRSLNKIIDQLLPDLVLVNRKYPHERTAEILSAISLLKKEGVTDPAMLEEHARSYEKLMEGKSRPDSKQHGKNLLAARKFREFVEVFHRYQKMLEETSRYDYEDMILHALSALKEHDWLLAEEQERYLYILVDEVQDLNGAQQSVIDLLTLPRTPEDKPNLFLVGDDDQAIYRFQGANLRNILGFHRRFPDAPVIAMTESFRCSQEILNAASRMIAHNTERLVGMIPGLQKTLSAFRGACGIEPFLHLAASDATEPWVIASLVEEKIAKGVPASEIAILTQTNAELRPIFEVLRQKGIPVELSSKEDLLAHPLVRQLVTILQAIEDPRDVTMASALSCDCFRCHPADLGRIFDMRRADGISLCDLLLRFDVPEAKDPLPLHRRDALLRARDTLLDLHQKLPSRTIVSTMEHALKDTGLLPSLAPQDDATKSASSMDPLDLWALAQFFSWAKYRAYEQPFLTMGLLLSDLDFYMQGDNGGVRLTYESPHLSADGVKLMTAHKSKGLEFDVVILPNFRDGHWDKRHNPHGISLPEDLLFGWSKEQKIFERSQDERRLAYVAMTRARRELHFTSPQTLSRGNAARSTNPSAFVAEAENVREEVAVLSEETLPVLTLLSPPRVIDEEFRSFLRHRLEQFSLSVTALNHFLEDPLMFLERDLLQMPQSKEASLVYGNAVHDALKQWAFSYQSGQAMSATGFIDTFASYLSHREILTEKECASLLLSGQESLPRYYRQRLESFRGTIGFVEKPLRAVIHGKEHDIPLKGMTDRIDLLGPASSIASVIDYKTGRPKSEKQILEGDYFRQLVFYALLLERDLPFLQASSFTLDFVGEGIEDPILRSFAITEEQKRELLMVIEAVWAKVTALDFTPIS